MVDDHDRWPGRLSEHVDGLLPEAEGLELESHLAECAGCREIADDLVRVRDAARTFQSLPPARDLWPEIRSAMDAGRVIDLPERTGPSRGGIAPSAAAHQRRGRPGVYLSLPQVTAIAAAFVVVTAWGAWQAVGTLAVSGPPRASGSTAAEAGASAAPEPVRLAAARDPAVAAAADEVERLQRLLEERHESLDVATVAVLEKNLAIIDRAIRESLAALEVDPGNQFVEEHLRLSVDRKVDYLRQATSLPDRVS